MQSFIDFLNEDVTSEVAKLQADIATLDANIQQKTAPLLQQRQRLQKMLVIKQKQKSIEDQRNQQQQKQQPNQQQDATQSPMQANQQAPTQGG